MQTIRMTALTLIMTFAVAAIPVRAMAHCQVPCGIYDDHARVESMLEDVTTVRKAVTMLVELNDKTDVQSRQQFTRWVMNKEEHAQKIINTISDYFLTQRVKASQADYEQRLKKHHAVIVDAMKAKQHASMEYVDALQKSVEALMEYYPGK